VPCQIPRNVIDVPSTGSLHSLVAHFDNRHEFGLMQQRKRILEGTACLAAVFPPE
jgi:hypothetical protein